VRRLLGLLIAMLLAVPALGSGPVGAQEADATGEEATATAAALPTVLILGDSVVEGICKYSPGELNQLRQSFTVTCDGLDVPPFYFTGRDGPGLIRSHVSDFDDNLVLALGYNDGFNTEAFRAGAEAIMQMPEVRATNVYWLTIRNVNGQYTGANQVLRDLDARYANLTLLDWHAWSLADPRPLTGADGVHLTEAGKDSMANLITYALNPKMQCRAPSGIVRSPKPTSARGYYLLDSSGKVHAYPSGADHYGDVQGKGAAPVSMQTTPSGNGYWILTAEGRVHRFGDAKDHGDMPRNFPNVRLAGPVRRIEPHPSGAGYWLMGSDGGIFTFGSNTGFYGSVPGVLGPGVVPFGETISITATASGRGYFLVGDDGGVFTFGDARFLGSVYDKLPPGRRLDSPVEALSVHPGGKGYWLYASDGGIFSFGGVNFFGSVPGLGLCMLPPTAAMRPSETGNGYWVVTNRGWVIEFGDAKNYGGDPTLAPGVQVIDMAVRP